MYKKLFLSLLFFVFYMFSIYYANAAASLSAPFDSAKCLSNPVDFVWSNKANDVEKYVLVIDYRKDTNSAYENFITEEFPLTVTTTSYSLLPAVQYIWKVITNYTVASGKASDTSLVRTFYTSETSELLRILNDGGAHCSTIDIDSCGLFIIEWDCIDSIGSLCEIEYKNLLTEKIDTLTTLLSLNKDTLTLPFNVNYFIRIRRVSIFDNECFSPWLDSITVNVVKAPLTPEFSEYSISDGAGCISITPVFKWVPLEVLQGTTIRYFVEVSETEDFEDAYIFEAIDNDSVRVLLNKYNNTYYWRLFSVQDQTGCKSEYSSVRSFMTIPEPVSLITPFNNAKGSEAFKENSSTIINFSWSNKNDTSLGNYTYILQVSSSDIFINTDIIAIDTVVNQCNFELELNDEISNQTLFWRVKAIYRQTDTTPACFTDWSEIRSFKTPYVKPTIIYPTETETCFKGIKPLKWNRVADARSYEIYFSSDKNFIDNIKTKIINIDINIDSIYIDFDLERETYYYWKIRAVDSINNSFFSDVAKFRTSTIPVKLISPENNSGGMDSLVTFVWSERENSSYKFQLSLDEEFTKVVIDTNLNSSSIDVKLNTNNVTYYWRVSVTPLDDILCASDFTAPFVLVTKLSSPILLTPQSSEQLYVNTVNFTWSYVENATKYELQISIDSTFKDDVKHIIKIFDNYYDLNSLLELKTYYWRVKALNDNTESNWSNYLSFTTGLEIPSIPILLKPYRASKKVSILPTLVWRKCSNANSYILEYSKDNFENENNVVSIHSILDTTYTFTEPLDNYSLYYWRVCAVNDTLIDTTYYSLLSVWSEVLDFRTIKAIPNGRVELLTPVNNTKDLIWDEIRLKWSPLDNSEYYKLQVSNSKDFNSFVIYSARIYDTKYSTLRYLDTSSTYYWRVCGENEAGTSDWSDIWCFSTSHLLSIYNTNIFEGISLTPNPAYENINIEFISLHNIDATISIVNTQGIEVISINGSYLAGNNIINLNVSGFTSGTYICYIMSGGKIIATSQFVVAK